jgi:hypothetical protein
MAKRRVPETVEDALDQAVGFVGKGRIAGIVGKSENVLGKWSDPDKAHHQVPLAGALEIDRQLALNGYPQPFAELVAARAQRNARAEQQLAHALAEQRPMQEVAAAVCEASRIVASVERAEADQVYSAAEVEDLCRKILALQKRLPALQSAIVAKRGRR